MVNKQAFEIVWDKKALDHLKDILHFLSTQSSQAPKIVRDGILSKLETIRTSILICEIDKLKDKPNKNFRAFVVYSYRITYQIKPEKREIRIVRVRHTSREPFGY